MKKQTANLFNQQVLDPEEQRLEDALERGELESVGNLEETKKMLADAARHQTLLGVLINEYVEGKTDLSL